MLLEFSQKGNLIWLEGAFYDEEMALKLANKIQKELVAGQYSYIMETELK